jgi:hypothetical protein
MDNLNILVEAKREYLEQLSIFNVSSHDRCFR